MSGDKMQVHGVRADGTVVHLGEATMAPRMKALELVHEYFGPFDPADEDHEGAPALYICEQLIEWMGKNPPSFTPKADT